MTEEDAIAILKEEGFHRVYTYEDGPNATYGDHTHDTKTAHIIVRGSMELTIDGRNVTLSPGKRFDIPAHSLHAAKMGPEGCRYVIGE